MGSCNLYCVGQIWRIPVIVAGSIFLVGCQALICKRLLSFYVFPCYTTRLCFLGLVVCGIYAHIMRGLRLPSTSDGV